MSTPDNIPIYWATLDEEAHGLSFVSLVDDPAIKRNFVALAAAKPGNLCAVNDDRVFKQQIKWNAGVQFAFPDEVVLGTITTASGT